MDRTEDTPIGYQGIITLAPGCTLRLGRVDPTRTRLCSRLKLRKEVSPKFEASLSSAFSLMRTECPGELRLQDKSLGLPHLAPPCRLAMNSLQEARDAALSLSKKDVSGAPLLEEVGLLEEAGANMPPVLRTRESSPFPSPPATLHSLKCSDAD